MLKQQLLTIKDRLASGQWRVRHPLGFWVQGTPTHVQKMQDALQHISADSHQDLTWPAYEAMTTIIAEIKPSRSRHSATDAFYTFAKATLKGGGQKVEQDVAAQADDFTVLAAAGSSATTSSGDRQYGRLGALMFAGTDNTAEPVYPDVDDKPTQAP